MMKTRQVLYIWILINTIIYAQGIKDQDFDGVPDKIDECKDTPFLHKVNANGCTTSILILPNETEAKNLTMTLGYGQNTNEDLKNRESQNNTKLQISYYFNNWGYTLKTGYYVHNLHEGMLDTTLKIKKRIKINPKLVIGLGMGIRLPSYDFKGNKTDAIFYSSLHYYPTTSLSFFGAYTYTAIGDEPEDEPLKNIHSLYIGTGYFFTNNLYLNLKYTIKDSKFVKEHDIRTISTSLYYKINQKWFTTFYYSRDVLDEDLHDNFILKIGYNFW